MSSMKFCLALAALGASQIYAAPINGTMNINGSVTVSLNMIDWAPAGGGTGSFSTTSPSTGFFTGIDGGNPPFYLGTVKDLTAPPSSVLNFLSAFTAPGFGGLFFDLLSIVAPTAPACTGSNPAINVSCSLGSFTLTNTPGNNVAVNMSLIGFFQNGADLSTRTPGGGTYTTQLPGTSVGAVYTTIVTNNSSISAAYSASYISSSVPEVSSFYLFGFGAGLVAFGAYRRRAQ